MACAPEGGPDEDLVEVASSERDDGSSGPRGDSSGADGSTGSGAATTAGAAHLSVLLTDAPGDFDAVPVTIASGEAYLAQPVESAEGGGGTGGSGGASGGLGGAGGAPSEAPAEPGWRRLVDSPARYDLLQIQNGATAALGSEDIAPGLYTQIRLIVSEAAVVVDGETQESRDPQRCARPGSS